jgi:hypothetical protein
MRFDGVLDRCGLHGDAGGRGHDACGDRRRHGLKRCGFLGAIFIIQIEMLIVTGRFLGAGLCSILMATTAATATATATAARLAAFGRRCTFVRR